MMLIDNVDLVVTVLAVCQLDRHRLTLADIV
jgi:hypothetical protein